MGMIVKRSKTCRQGKTKTAGTSYIHVHVQTQQGGGGARHLSHRIAGAVDVHNYALKPAEGGLQRFMTVSPDPPLLKRIQSHRQ